MNSKIVGILNRLRIAPKSMRKDVEAELAAAVDEWHHSLAAASSPSNAATVNALRDALNWPEVKGNALATATLCRSLRSLRNAK